VKKSTITILFILFFSSTLFADQIFFDVETDTKRTILTTGQTNDTDLYNQIAGKEPLKGSDDNYVTDAEKVVIGNTSGTNTGDQDISGKADKANVLELNNATAFTPDADYEPATKKYVDDNSGGGTGLPSGTDGQKIQYIGTTGTAVDALDGLASPVTNITTTGSITQDKGTVLADTTTANIIITFPDSTNKGNILRFVNTGTGTLTIKTVSNQDIAGESTQIISQINKGISILGIAGEYIKVQDSRFLKGTDDGEFTVWVQEDQKWVGTGDNFTLDLDSGSFRLPHRASQAGSFLTLGDGGVITFTSLATDSKIWKDDTEGATSIATTDEVTIYTITLDEAVSAGNIQSKLLFNNPWYRTTTGRVYWNGVLQRTYVFEGTGDHTFDDSAPFFEDHPVGDVFTVTIQSDVANYTVQDGGFLIITRSGNPDGAAITYEDETITGDWDFTGAFDISGAEEVKMGQLDFTASATPPALAGEFRYNSSVTGLAGNVFSYFDTMRKYILAYDTLPTIDGAVPTYNATNDDFDWIVPAGGGSFAFDTFPTYEDSPHISGIARNSDTLAIYSNDAAKWLTVGLTDTLDPTPVIPAVASVAIDGTDLAITYDMAVTQGSGYIDADLNIDGATMGNDVALTYVGGDTTATHHYTSAFAAIVGEVINLDYLGKADGLESSTGGDLAVFTDQAVTNSTSSGGGLIAALNCYQNNGDPLDTDGENVTAVNITHGNSGASVIIDSDSDEYSFPANETNGLLDPHQGSISFKYKHVSDIAYSYMFAQSSATDAFRLGRANLTNNMYFVINGINTTCTLTTNMFDGNEHTVVVTWDISTTTRKLYIDGNLEITATDSWTYTAITTGNMWIGNRMGLYASDAEFQDFKIYNTVIVP
jgi:hypothetical protein